MVISGRRSRVHKGLLHGTARGPELDDLRAHRIKIDATRASEYSAFGSSNSEMTQPSSAIIVAIKISMEYARLCMSMRRATPAIRHERGHLVSHWSPAPTPITRRGRHSRWRPRAVPPLWRRSRLAWVIVWHPDLSICACFHSRRSRLDSPLFSLSPHTPPSLSQQQRPGHPPGTPERPGDRNHGQDGEYASGYEARADGQASRSASAVSSRSASPVLTTLSGSSSSEAASVAARGQCSTLRRLRLGPPR